MHHLGMRIWWLMIQFMNNAVLQAQYHTSMHAVLQKLTAHPRAGQQPMTTSTSSMWTGLRFSKSIAQKIQKLC